LRSASFFTISVAQILSSVAPLRGRALGHEDAEVVDRVLEAWDKVADSGGTVPKPSMSSDLSPTTASGRIFLARIMSVCSAASWVVTWVSPEAAATAAGAPPS
jgi:hypothetical protein